MPRQDFYIKGQDLTAAGLFQLAAEEAARPGKLTTKSRKIMEALLASLELFDAQKREIEDLVEEKRAAGLLGKVRKFSRRQLYARVIRYTHFDGDPTPQGEILMRNLRQAMGFTDKDHASLLERLIDQGWAPPRPLSHTTSEDALARSLDPDPEARDKAPPPKLEESGQIVPPAKPALATPEDDEEIPASESISMAMAVPVATPSGELELGGIPGSVDNFDPFETTSGSDRLPLQAKFRGQQAGPPPDSRKQLAMGVALGALMVALPFTFWMGTQMSKPPPAPTQPTPKPPPPPPPTKVPTVKPTPPPPKPVDPLKAFQASVPALKDDVAGGRDWLRWVSEQVRDTAGVGAALLAHSKEHRAEINQTFALRNEQIFEAAQWGGKDGGFTPASLQQAHAHLSKIESAEDIPARLAHAYYLALLSFYMDSAKYPDYKELYQKLVPQLATLLRTNPKIGKSGAGIVLRVIGEDLRDGDNQVLADLGERLLEALL